MATVEERLHTLEEQVRVLNAKDAVRRVLSRYAVGVDGKRPEILREIFDSEAILSVPNWNIEERGREAILTFFADYWSRFDNPRRYYANEDITVAGSRAEAFMYFHVTQERDDESILGWGSYEWGFKFDNGNCLITKEVVHILAMTTLEEGWASNGGLRSF
jgi:hypothetical protein|tara:strand:+ start:70 stop:552 length:483 start_codon:yes stop_codon:yes gene_type:complete